MEANVWRLTFFLGGLFLFSLLGIIFRYRQIEGRVTRYRWLNNLALVFFNSFFVKGIGFFLTIGFSYLAINKVGLFYSLNVPLIANIIISVIILDFVIYWQHVFFHKVPLLWRLHRVHHSDIDFDTTTALRFHPLEILLSMIIKLLCMAVLGIHPWSLLVFEILLNFSAMFNHSNFTLPRVLEKAIKQLIVTPDMHRIHHSVERSETNSNYGFFLSLWDRLFSTYTVQSRVDSRVMEIGIERFRELKEQRLDKLITQPFRD